MFLVDNLHWFCFLIHSVSLCLLIAELRLLIFKVSIEILVLVLVIMVLIFGFVCVLSGTFCFGNYSIPSSYSLSGHPIFLQSLWESHLSTVSLLCSFCSSAWSSTSCNSFKFGLFDINLFRLFISLKVFYFFNYGR